MIFFLTSTIMIDVIFYLFGRKKNKKSFHIIYQFNTYKRIIYNNLHSIKILRLIFKLLQYTPTFIEYEVR